MNKIQIIEQPTSEPITLADAKLHLRVDHDSEDSLIGAYLSASREYCERFTGLALTEQTIEYVGNHDSDFVLPLSPVASITSITSVIEGVEKPVTEYWADLSAPPAVIYKKDNWPVEGIIRVRYVTATASVPNTVRSAILLHLGMLYEGRGDEKEQVYTINAIESLLRPWRMTMGMA